MLRFKSTNCALLASVVLLLMGIISCSKDEPKPTTKYTVTISAGTGGSVSSVGGSYEVGATISVTATPEAEYVFDGWSNGSNENPLQISITSNQSIQANFIKRKYALNITVEGEGTVTEEIVSTGKDYDSGMVVRLTAVPIDGWEFIGWSGAINSVENPIQLTMNDVKNLNVSFDLSQFVSKSERYSNINETTGYFNNQFYFENYFDSIDQEAVLHFDSEGVNYKVNGRDNLYYDFNNDGYVEVFGYGLSFPQGQDPGTILGKYVLIDNFKKNSSNKIIVDSNINNSGGKFNINDFNNDSKYEILEWQHNGKTNWYNEAEDVGGQTSFLIRKPSLILIDSQLNMSVSEIGVRMDSHCGTSGDVNNDGKIDFIQWPIPSADVEFNNPTAPIVNINEGNFNFTQLPLLKDFNGYWNATAVELFDLNNDDNLDIIVGWWIGNTNFSDSFAHELQINSPVILWGDGSGTFSLENSTKLFQSHLSNLGVRANILGYGFTDYDSDGDIDILLTTTRDEEGGTLFNGLYYNNYYLLFYENLGSKSFIEKTSEVIIGDHDQSMTKFTNFYSIKMIDKDGDGDFDIVPDEVTTGWNWDYLKNLYWENSNGTYTRREN